jgi:hypothetical protein
MYISQWLKCGGVSCSQILEWEVSLYKGRSEERVNENFRGY